MLVPATKLQIEGATATYLRVTTGATLQPSPADAEKHISALHFLFSGQTPRADAACALRRISMTRLKTHEPTTQ